MYGYLKPNAAETSTAVYSRYRRYYCTLCHALWRQYGRLSRLAVSYDMTFAAVVLYPFGNPITVQIGSFPSQYAAARPTYHAGMHTDAVPYRIPSSHSARMSSHVAVCERTV